MRRPASVLRMEPGYRNARRDADKPRRSIRLGLYIPPKSLGTGLYCMVAGRTAWPESMFIKRKRRKRRHLNLRHTERGPGAPGSLDGHHFIKIKPPVLPAEQQGSGCGENGLSVTVRQRRNRTPDPGVFSSAGPIPPAGRAVHPDGPPQNPASPPAHEAAGGTASSSSSEWR